MKRFVLSLLSISLVGCSNPQSKSSFKGFSLHLFQEPMHLDPARVRGSSASYFFYNTLRGLYRIDENGQLAQEGGQCKWTTPKQLDCEIKQRWSNGDPVTGGDYIRSFHHLMNPKTGSPRSQLLARVKFGSAILQGRKPVSSIGITSPTPNRLRFFFDKTDAEFLYKLASTALFPTHKNSPRDKLEHSRFIGNGPYKIKEWRYGEFLHLTKNSFYDNGNERRPDVMFYFIDDEMTAYRLYKNKKLSFLRRVPAKMVDQVQGGDDFHKVSMARFDYIGFGPRLARHQNLRRALVHSVNYEKLRSLLKASGLPGCPSIPSSWIDNPPCHKFLPKKSGSAMAKVPDEIKNTPFQLHVSQLGGNDIRQQAEFLQHEWQSYLQLNIEIRQVEQKVFISQLRKSPPDIFRKGVGLDRPTCLNALETFSEDSSQNYISWENKKYLEILKKMSGFISSESYKQLCRDGIMLLMEKASIIPLGEMHFTVLASRKYVGWTLNPMNQLDLSQLSLRN